MATSCSFDERSRPAKSSAQDVRAGQRRPTGPRRDREASRASRCCTEADGTVGGLCHDPGRTTRRPCGPPETAQPGRTAAPDVDPRTPAPRSRGRRAHRHGRHLRRERPAHDDRARAPRRRIQQGRGHLRPVCRRGARGRRRHLYRRRARQHPQPRDGPAGRARRHARHPPRRDGPRRRDPRRAAPLARLRRLRAPGGRPAAPAARGLLRARRRRRAGRLAGRGDPRAAPARPGHLRRARRLPAPGPHPLPRDLGRRVRRRRRPGPVPGGGGAVAAAQALLLPRVLPGPRWRPSTPRCWSAGSSRRTGSGWRTGRRTSRTRAAGDDAGPVRRLVPRPRRGAAGPRHADRPGEPLVPRPERPAARGLADGGLRARPLAGRGAAARRRPVRRDRGAGRERRAS